MKQPEINVSKEGNRLRVQVATSDGRMAEGYVTDQTLIEDKAIQLMKDLERGN